MAGYVQGVYACKYPEKYKGDAKQIVYRSSYELKAFNMIECDPNVIAWNSEEIIIPYMLPGETKIRRYFMDIWMKVNTPEGIKEMLIEIKPKCKTELNINPNSSKKAKLQILLEWNMNQSKWKAARQYCKNRGWVFLLWTEQQLGIGTFDRQKPIKRPPALKGVQRHQRLKK